MAGRTKGTPNKLTAHNQRQVAITGDAPLDIMIRRMRYYAWVAESKFKKVAELRQKPVLSQAEALQASTLESEAELCLDKADDAARGAAPYVHNRLATVTVDGTVKNVHEYDPEPARLKMQSLLAATPVAEAPARDTEAVH